MNTTAASKKRWVFALLSCAAIFLFCAALYQAQHFAALSEHVQGRFQEPALTIEALRKGLGNARKHQGDVTDATIWDERKDQSVSGAQRRSAALRLLLVYGDAERAYNALFLSGAYPAPGDDIGCAVDQKAADALFGGENAVGNTLTYQEKTYVVRGVFAGMDGVVVAQADDQDESKFGAIALAVDPAADGKEAASSFLLNSVAANPSAVIDAPFLVQFINALSLLPAWLVCFALVGRMILRLFSLRASPLRCLAAAAATVAAAALLFYVSEFFITIPDRFIPTKWSDFSFWSQRIAQARADAAQIRALEPLLSDRMRTVAAAWCGAFSLCTSALYLGALKVKPAFSPSQLFCAEFGAIAATFLSLLALSALGKPVEATRALWGIWPLCIALSYVPMLLRRPQEPEAASTESGDLLVPLLFNVL